MALDAGKFYAFIGGFLHRRDAVIGVPSKAVDEWPGLYQVLADKPLSAEELAKKTGTDLRCVQEWLAPRAARGHIQYDAASQRFWMTEQQAYALAQQPEYAFMRDAFATLRNTKLFPR
ncbi:hypothetical protein PQR02_03920 [Paraburkholderia sediminicola]|uniref:Uncharacterized protein n=1 Tax=Paraburkholderia rhynchosiae TaxID=487049 RepID=A0ACC7NC81_9BURK